MAERPILFSTEMVKAILAGRKTQTRRLINNIQIEDGKAEGTVNFEYRTKRVYEAGINVDKNSSKFPFIGLLHLCKYGKPGDLLWVRETFLKLDRDHVITSEYAYKANGDEDTEELRKGYIKSGRNYKWKPSIHMPKDAARIWLMIKDIAVERVQDISEEDAIAEGIEDVRHLHNYTFQIFKDYKGFMPDGYQTPRFSFCSLWKSINGDDSWKANPWVWVIKFKVLSTIGKPSEDVILSALASLREKEGKEVTP